MRAAGVTGLIALVLLAGCAGFSGPSYEVNVTPAEVPRIQEPPDHSSPADTLPPGLTEDGMVDTAAHIVGHLDNAEGSAMGGLVEIEGPAREKRFDGEPYITPVGHGSWVWNLYRMALGLDTLTIEKLNHSGGSEKVTVVGDEDRFASGQSVERPDEREYFLRDSPDTGGAIPHEHEVLYRIRSSGQPEAYHNDVQDMTAVSYVTPEGRIILFILQFRYPDQDGLVTVTFHGET